MSDQQQQFLYGSPATRLPLPQPIHGPGPEPDSMEMEMQRNSGMQAHNSYVMNLGRTAEPDDDRNAQPDQHRHYYDGNSGEMMQDSSTITSQRSGVNTVATDEQTLQRGSLSKKPSPDDPGSKPPSCHAHPDTTNGRIEQFPDQDQSNHNTGAMSSVAVGSLSFPSPPSVEDEEEDLPYRSDGSGQFAALQSILTGREPKEDAITAQNCASTGVMEKEDDNLRHGGSKRRRFRIAIAVLFLVIVIVAIVATVVATSSKDDTNKDAKEHGQNLTTLEVVDIGTLHPTMVPTVAPSQSQTPVPSADIFVDEQEIVLTSANQTNTNQTSSSSSKEVLEGTFDPSHTSSVTTSAPSSADANDESMTQPLVAPSKAPSMLRPT